MEIILLAIAALIAVIVIISRVSKHDSAGKIFEAPQRRAGRYGEERAAVVIQSVLRDGDCLLSNIQISYDGRPAELDHVVVNKYGVFIIEVKNYSGYIIGEEDDYQWKKYKRTSAGIIYVKSVKNPIKQVKRQVYILAKYLDSYGVDVWVNGYALLMRGNSPVDSNCILSSIDEIDEAIHTKGRMMLSQDTIEKIKRIL